MEQEAKGQTQRIDRPGILSGLSSVTIVLRQQSHARSHSICQHCPGNLSIRTCRIKHASRRGCRHGGGDGGCCGGPSVTASRQPTRQPETYDSAVEHFHIWTYSGEQPSIQPGTNGDLLGDMVTTVPAM